MWTSEGLALNNPSVTKLVRSAITAVVVMILVTSARPVIAPPSIPEFGPAIDGYAAYDGFSRAGAQGRTTWFQPVSCCGRP